MSREWLDDAACRDADVAIFYPDPSNHAGIEVAKNWCATCPAAVRAACLDDAMTAEGALAASHRWGIRGGVTGAERAAAYRSEFRRKQRAGVAK